MSKIIYIDEDTAKEKRKTRVKDPFYFKPVVNIDLKTGELFTVTGTCYGIKVQGLWNPKNTSEYIGELK